jgi:hypothetical protein
MHSANLLFGDHKFAGQLCREVALGKSFAVGFQAVAVGPRRPANRRIPVVTTASSTTTSFARLR